MPIWLIPLLSLLLPWITDIVKTIIQAVENYSKDPSTQQDVMDTSWAIVSGIEKGHPEWDGDTKRRYARDALKLYANQQNVQIRDSTLNLMIELSLEMLKQDEVKSQEVLSAVESPKLVK